MIESSHAQQGLYRRSLRSFFNEQKNIFFSTQINDATFSFMMKRRYRCMQVSQTVSIAFYTVLYSTERLYLFSYDSNGSSVQSFVHMSMILDVRARFMQPGNCVIIQSDQSRYSVRWGITGLVRLDDDIITWLHESCQLSD